MASLIQNDGLPAVPVFTGSSPVLKVHFLMLLSWYNERSRNVKITEAQLEAELTRCANALKAKDAAKRTARQKRGKEAA